MSFAYGSNAQFSHATSFAMPIVMAAAFDDDLIEQVGTVISTEARAFSNAGRAGLDFWTPNINPYKDPRWGRGSEVSRQSLQVPPSKLKIDVNADPRRRPLSHQGICQCLR